MSKTPKLDVPADIEAQLEAEAVGILKDHVDDHRGVEGLREDINDSVERLVREHMSDEVDTGRLKAAIFSALLLRMQSIHRRTASELASLRETLKSKAVQPIVPLQFDVEREFPPEFLAIELDALELSHISATALSAVGVKTVGDIVTRMQTNSTTFFVGLLSAARGSQGVNMMREIAAVLAQAYKQIER